METKAVVKSKLGGAWNGNFASVSLATDVHVFILSPSLPLLFTTLLRYSIYILYRWLSDVWKRDNVGTLELSINTIDNSVTAADWGKNAALRDKLNPGLTF